MPQGIKRIVLLIALSSLIGGCSLFDGLNWGGKEADDVKTDGTASIADCLKAARAKLKDVPADIEAADFTEKALAHVDRFLDCAVGPAASDEARLLRGHAVVALASRYAALNAGADIRGIPNLDLRPYPDLDDDVAATLNSIEDAEVRLRSAEPLFTKNPSCADMPAYLCGHEADYPAVTKRYNELGKIRRILAVLRVAKNAAKPTVQRTKGTLLRFGFVSGGSVLSARQALKDAITNLEKYIVVRTFGEAYRKDLRSHLSEIDKRRPQTPTKADWERWDRPLKGACQNMAKLIDGREHCIPTVN